MSEFYTWLSPLSDFEKEFLESNNLGNVASFFLFPLQYSLFSASFSYWNSDLHLFRFRTRDACPTVEEFSRFLGVSSDGPLLAPSTRAVTMQHLAELLHGLSPHLYPSILYDRGLHIDNLVAHFRRCGNPVVSCSVLAVALLGKYLFYRDGTYCSPQVLVVFDLIRNGAAYVPTILGETFEGLGSQELQDSPYLLQVSSSSRFSVVFILTSSDILCVFLL